MLEIKNLHVSINNNKILKGLNLSINKGEVHAIMGPNGSGKSTLASVIAGREEYEVNKGSIIYSKKKLLKLSADERAIQGIFLAFQYPVEIPGVSTTNFIKTAVNQIRKSKGKKPLDAVSFLKVMKEKMKIVKVNQTLLSRSINDGFSGGEKKRNEIFQMAMLDPKLAILDETDSGLDIDALRTVAQGINTFRNSERSIILITHYQRILDYLKPDKIHILMNGSIVKTGDIDLVNILEDKGYKWIKKGSN